MADWDHMLDEIERRLTQTLAFMDAGPAPAPDPERAQEWNALGARLDGLSARMAPVEALVRQADLALEEAELSLQAQAAASAALRQKLADWAGRAIG